MKKYRLMYLSRNLLEAKDLGLKGHEETGIDIAEREFGRKLKELLEEDESWNSLHVKMVTEE